MQYYLLKLMTFLAVPAVDANLPNKGTTNEGLVLQRLTNYAYLFAAIVCTIILVTAGIQYITAAGDSSKIATAKKAITYAIAGLIVIILAAAITNFVLGAF